MLSPDKIFNVFFKMIMQISFSYFFFTNINSYVFASESFDKTIEIKSFIRGLPLGKAQLKINIKKNKYKIQMTAKAIGFFSIFSSWSQQANSNGQFINNSLISHMYFSKDQSNKKEGHMKIDYSNGLPNLISAQPDPRKDNRREIIDKEILKNVVDPIAGILNLGLKEKCKKNSDIFDGKRRYAITSNLLRTEVLHNEFFLIDKIQAIKCSFRIIKIAGYTEKELKKFPTAGYLWLTKYSNTDLYFPVKLEIQSNWGNFISLIRERIDKDNESNYM